MKGETTCSKVVEPRVETNRKAPLLLPQTPGNSSCRRGLWGWLWGLQEAWQLLAGVRIPTGAVPGLEWLLCTQNISLQRHWWGDGAGKLPHHCRIHWPESESQSPRLSQPPQGLGLSAPSFLSSPFPQPSVEQTVRGGPGQAMGWTPLLGASASGDL